MSKLINLQEEKVERAVVFCPIMKDTDKEFQFAEIERLCKSAHLEVVKIFYQDGKALTKSTFIGSGKVQEIAEFVKTNDIDVLVVDDKLTGSQLRNLGDIIDIKVIDRTMLILDIFLI